MEKGPGEKIRMEYKVKCEYCGKLISIQKIKPILKYGTCFKCYKKKQQEFREAINKEYLKEAMLERKNNK